jgi:LPS export ABC transporter protein LptC
MKNFNKHLFVLVLLCLFFSCKKNTKPGTSIESQIDNVIYGNPIKIEITKDENSVMTIHADTLIRANGGNTTLFGRVYADLFDKEGIKSSMLYSDSAIVYTNSDSIKAFGNVLIESLKGYKLLTDEIILFNNSNLVKSNKDIIFTSNSNDTLYGTGFWSNFDMSNSQIQRPRGSMTK